MIKKRAASEIRRGRPFRTRNFITGPTDYLRFFSFGFFLNFFPTHSHFFYTLFNLLESVSRRFVEFSRYEAAGLAGLIENFVWFSFDLLTVPKNQCESREWNIILSEKCWLKIKLEALRRKKRWNVYACDNKYAPCNF